MFKFKTLLFLFIAVQSSYSQDYSISGYVEDLNTGERIIGAYVIDSISRKVAQTNNYGFYNIKKVNGKVALQATYTGFRSEMKYLSLVYDTIIGFKIYPVSELKEVVVTSSLYNHKVNTPLGLTVIPVKQLTSIPSLGEPDLLKSIQSQPGIKGGIEGSAGIFVRGGGGGENLFMLDDVPMYNVSHLYGFFSAFNSSAVKDIKLLKGCFPARYGGRASSVIDVRCLDGNNKSIKGEVSIGFISSKFSLDGPLINDKTTFMVSGRRSYFDLYANSLKKASLLNKDFPDYYFYDLNARLTHTFSQKDKLFLNFYKGNDHNNNKNESTVTNEAVEVITTNHNETSGWGNLIGSLRWNHTFGNSLFANTTLAFSSYDYFTQSQSLSIDKKVTENKTITKNYLANYTSSITDLIVKTDLDYSLSNSHKLYFGAGNSFHIFHPGKNNFSMDDQELNEKSDTSYTNNTIDANEPFVYIEDEYKATQKLNINAGIRLSGFISGRDKYINAEPRISVNYFMLPKLAFKTGYSRMVQYMHLLSSSGVSMPTDLWVPALEGLQPMKSDQVDAGFTYDWDNIALFSIEVYQKWLSNTSDFRNGASLVTDLSPWYDKVTQGKGNSKGIEVSIEKQQGKLYGSISYTLSKADRIYTDLNDGRIYPFKYDRRYDFNISSNYQISKKWDVSAIWLYGSGYPITLPVDMYSPAVSYISYEVVYYPSRNNFRLPAYHRLDVGFHYKTINRFGEHSLSFDVFNAYNRKNTISIYYAFYAFNNSYLLPIVPTITYTLKFK
jgi:hypothetical protein